jgi:hypothetical protein
MDSDLSQRHARMHAPDNMVHSITKNQRVCGDYGNYIRNTFSAISKAFYARLCSNPGVIVSRSGQFVLIPKKSMIGVGSAAGWRLHDIAHDAMQRSHLVTLQDTGAVVHRSRQNCQDTETNPAAA